MSRVCCCLFAHVSQETHKNAHICVNTCILSREDISVYLCLSVCVCVCVCVCICDDNPVITASVLALQRLTALFYSDLYNQCHISNTTNQTLRVSPRNLSHTCTHTCKHTHTHAHTHTHTHTHMHTHRHLHCMSSFMFPAGHHTVSNRC